MKNFRLFLIAITAAFIFPACNDEGDYASYTEFATVKLLPGNDYYFEIDGQQKTSKLYPGDRSRIGGFTAEEGQRVVIEFNLLAEKKESYDYNGAIYNVRNIYTGVSKIVDTQAELDEIGDDPIELMATQCSHTYLSVLVTYALTNNSKHSFVLVRNNVKEPGKKLDGYYNVELRHNAGGDKQGNIYRSNLSFDLAALTQSGELDGMKGLLIRILTAKDKELFYKAELPQRQ